MKTVAIIQPNYLPWRGYFDFMHEADIFVFLDDVQYTVRDWRNRNRILKKDGAPLWLTVPTLGGRNQLIKEVMIDDTQNWRATHLNALRHSYNKTPGFANYFPRIEAILNQHVGSLSALDVKLTEEIANWLSIDTTFLLASDLESTGSKDEKLIQLVKSAGGDRYLSGPAAKAYLKPDLWTQAGIQLSFKDYSGYPEYPQRANPFQANVSIMDLMFMVGESAPDYIWGHLRQRV